MYLKRGRGGHILNSEAERAETYSLKICHHANTLHMSVELPNYGGNMSTSNAAFLISAQENISEKYYGSNERFDIGFVEGTGT